MSEKTTTENCDLLFEYLRSILYDSEIEQPDFSALDEPFQKLGAGLRVLQKAVEEMRAYSEQLSIGELSGAYPSRDNFLCANLKNLHANLNHLTWQAKRVAAGDYSQHVSYLGEFSVAFNTMIQQLKEREEILHEQIDIAEEKLAEDDLASRAYFDAGTGVHNRFYFEEYLQEQLQNHKKLVLCFMDLDGLKYVNDHFGHNEGDVYIKRFVDEILASFRTTDTFARLGGDEFCLLLPRADIGQIRAKLEEIRKHFIESNPADYPSSFSYGLVQTDGVAGDWTPEALLDEADRRMYEYKKKYKPGNIPSRE